MILLVIGVGILSIAIGLLCIYLAIAKYTPTKGGKDE